ncbi:hypothetical protein F4813DRAFT_73699 [Daldinia decipiens]|uniref:uncharacterized protein n=1 Tax=Daldinia decipiens TaxID=326647 RepID=UPI0020C55A65|nr:uncharacterized protein F4813DRAFT_73699 [Daldinia decipiens]KAI1657780.1 hypothetical protein F4813DRAFT_73699 [Daldinia decipiens]
MVVITLKTRLKCREDPCPTYQIKGFCVTYIVHALFMRLYPRTIVISHFLCFGCLSYLGPGHRVAPSYVRDTYIYIYCGFCQATLTYVLWSLPSNTYAICVVTLARDISSMRTVSKISTHRKGKVGGWANEHLAIMSSYRLLHAHAARDINME